MYHLNVYIFQKQVPGEKKHMSSRTEAVGDNNGGGGGYNEKGKGNNDEEGGMIMENSE